MFNESTNIEPKSNPCNLKTGGVLKLFSSEYVINGTINAKLSKNEDSPANIKATKRFKILLLLAILHTSVTVSNSVAITVERRCVYNKADIPKDSQYHFL
ncbi:hypothetical protein GCM10025879_18820 [Leuconostoc litchii]|nr:hypothetical protein GCM10025879_18820 [Leuconostoc litchii]